MDVLTGARMKTVDEETIKRYCPGIELMERAGNRVTEFILSRYPKGGFKAAIFVGPGNNGGDALVVARRLCDEGLACSLHYLTDPETFPPDSAKNYQRLRKRLDKHRRIKEINSTRPDWSKVVENDLRDTTVIVDGLFGTGLSRTLGDRAAEIVRLINRCGTPVVSIDIPSGLHTDTGEVLGVAVKADHTVTMGFPKVGMLFYPAKRFVGELIVADLEFPDEVLDVNSLGIYWLDRHNAATRLPTRPPDGHKYRMGTVLVVAGSRAYTGAALLAAEAALRSGCGIVYVAVPKGIRPVIQTGLREAIVVPVPETAAGAVAEGTMDVLMPYLEKADTVVIGPGLTTDPETLRVVERLVRECPKPMVLDADALNGFAGNIDRLAGAGAPLVLTPHSGELGRLLERDVPKDPVQRIELTRETAKHLGVTLVHKGAPTLIASGDGTVWVNQHGNSALATAGSGDVLAGLIGGIHAQGATGLDAACVACFVHGRAAEYASDESGPRAVIAGDLLSFVGDATLEIEAELGW